MQRSFIEEVFEAERLQPLPRHLFDGHLVVDTLYAVDIFDEFGHLIFYGRRTGFALDGDNPAFGSDRGVEATGGAME